MEGQKVETLNGRKCRKELSPPWSSIWLQCLELQCPDSANTSIAPDWNTGSSIRGRSWKSLWFVSCRPVGKPQPQRPSSAHLLRKDLHEVENGLVLLLILDRHDFSFSRTCPHKSRMGRHHIPAITKLPPGSPEDTCAGRGHQVGLRPLTEFPRNSLSLSPYW